MLLRSTVRKLSSNKAMETPIDSAWAVPARDKNVRNAPRIVLFTRFLLSFEGACGPFLYLLRLITGRESGRYRLRLGRSRFDQNQYRRGSQQGNSASSSRG